MPQFFRVDTEPRTGCPDALVRAAQPYTHRISRTIGKNTSPQGSRPANRVAWQRRRFLSGSSFSGPSRVKIAVHFLFQFEVEEHAAHSAAPPLDAVFFLLIDPVQFGVVFGLSRLHKTSIDFLVIRNLPDLFMSLLPAFVSVYIRVALAERDLVEDFAIKTILLKRRD